MEQVLNILQAILFSRTIISFGSSDDGGSTSSYDTSSTTTTSSNYNSTTSYTAVFGTSLFNYS